MPVNVVPPEPILGSPFKKAIKVTLNKNGTIDVAAFREKGGYWNLVPGTSYQGVHKLGGELPFDMGVADGGRGIYTEAPEDWSSAWRGTSNQFLGRHPQDKSPHVFGEADFSGGGQPGVFAARGVVHTLTKISGKEAVRLVTKAGVTNSADPNGRLEALSDLVATRMIERDPVPRIAIVLWLEENQAGFVHFPQFPKQAGGVKVTL